MDQSRSGVASAVDLGVEWRALGPVEVMVGGRLVDLGPAKQRALFGLLLSRVDQPVALDAVSEELWEGAPPPAATASLRAYVSNLRRVLEPSRAPRAPAAVLRTRAAGYLLDSHGVEFDVHRFTGHATAGREALSRGDPQRALSEFDAALGLWRGPAYADMRDAAWVAPEVARLEEQRLSVVEGRCAALLEAGAHHVVVEELEVHVRDHPLRECGWELLALALYRAGRQAEAREVLREFRVWLAGELAIDPAPVLQRLERDILTQAPILDWHPPASPRTVTSRIDAAHASWQATRAILEDVENNKEADAPPRTPRQTRIWCVTGGPVNAGQPVHIAFAMVAPQEVVDASRGDSPDQLLPRPVNLRVLLQAEHATVQPMTQVVALDVDRTSKPILFQVVPTEIGQVELVFRVYLDRDSQLLQEIRAELPVIQPEQEVTAR
jgi:DNA-binding SARP family transcriptional activator